MPVVELVSWAEKHTTSELAVRYLRRLDDSIIDCDYCHATSIPYDSSPSGMIVRCVSCARAGAPPPIEGDTPPPA